MLHALTSFRFIAAFMVFLFHLGLFRQYQLGTAGVQFFFVLSGFILAFNYHSKFKELNRAAIYTFYKARFAKVYPVHVLTFLIASPLVILYFHPNGFYWLKLGFMSILNLLLVQSYIPSEATYFNFNGVSWTLSVEAFFYISFPFLLWLFNKYKVTATAVKPLSVLFSLWLLLLLLNIRLDGENPWYVWLLHIFPVTRCFEFSAGVILGLLFIERSDQGTRNKSFFHGMEIGCVVLFAGLLFISKSLDEGMVRGVYFVPLWSLLIYTFAFQAGVLSKLLSNKLFVYLGEISFSFYMMHQLVIRYMDFLHLGRTANFILCFSLSILFSALVYHLYEEPLRKKIRSGSQKQNRTAKTPLPARTL